MPGRPFGRELLLVCSSFTSKLGRQPLDVGLQRRDVGFKSGHQCGCVRTHGRGLGGTHVIRDPHARPPVVPRHSRPLATISTASDRLGIDTKPDASLGVGHPLAVSHVRTHDGGTCPGRDYRRLMVEEGLKRAPGEPAQRRSAQRARRSCRQTPMWEPFRRADSRPLALPYCLESVCDQDHGHTTRLAIELLPSVMDAYRVLRGSPPGSTLRATTMKRDNVTFDLPHDEHVRDFRMFVADTAARRRLGAPARQRVYANRRLLIALV
jgi:hypothetical protein